VFNNSRSSICPRYWRRKFFKVTAFSATSGSRKATLTARFDFQHRVSFCVLFYVVAISLKCTNFALGAWDRHTDGRTDGQHRVMPHIFDGGAYMPVWDRAVYCAVYYTCDRRGRILLWGDIDVHRIVSWNAQVHFQFSVDVIWWRHVLAVYRQLSRYALFSATAVHQVHLAAIIINTRYI